MDALAASLQTAADWITVHITMWVLIATGLFLTVITRGVQVRHLPDMVRQVGGSRSGAEGGISSFQAFAISLAARVGVGNVFGVAAALLMGGPGAVFWMWVVAGVGMATAFFEATLAQVFKVRASDGSFRGGPAFYMARGVGNRTLAAVFAAITVVTCGFVITSVQSNAIAGTLVAALGGGSESPLPGFGGLSAAQLVVAGLVLVLTAVVVFGGIRAVARVTEWMAPVMALVYIVLILIICLVNLDEFLRVIGRILSSAFAPEPLVGGLGGGVLAAVINGTKRGLFSNEAGQGTAPNAAATATVSHPVQQGAGLHPIPRRVHRHDRRVHCHRLRHPHRRSPDLDRRGGRPRHAHHARHLPRVGRLDGSAHGGAHLRARLLLDHRRLRLLRRQHELSDRRQTLGVLGGPRRLRRLRHRRCGSGPRRRVERRRHRHGGDDAD